MFLYIGIAWIVLRDWSLHPMEILSGWHGNYFLPLILASWQQRKACLHAWNGSWQAINSFSLSLRHRNYNPTRLRPTGLISSTFFCFKTNSVSEFITGNIQLTFRPIPDHYVIELILRNKTHSYDKFVNVGIALGLTKVWIEYICFK